MWAPWVRVDLWDDVVRTGGEVAGCLGEDQAGLCNLDGLNYSPFTRTEACTEKKKLTKESLTSCDNKETFSLFFHSLVQLTAYHFLSISPHTDPSSLVLLYVNVRSHFHFFFYFWTFFFFVSVVVHHVHHQSPNFTVLWQLTKCPSCQI